MCDRHRRRQWTWRHVVLLSYRFQLFDRYDRHLLASFAIDDNGASNRVDRRHDRTDPIRLLIAFTTEATSHSSYTFELIFSLQY